ncbi:Hypothetical predicted protein [Cloeon dipterum]|uniref:RecF/RecN/SMC N-terminal domain-containing protein n=1 Tax=Cloeon dipterum TaxID=197152 RepID=A0A8S1DMN7_9INSE|nr:Hypothetical predicted protein [Cloeon dipterum]
MPAFLKYIAVDNFKSYWGSQKIGPLKPFTAVIGPNGSGKSNFMDAISFVMGEKNIVSAISRSASVTAIFELEDGIEKSFTRVVLGSSSENRIDEETVSSQQYLSELERLGINTKAKNFLVFQGAVESIALKNPKERTALFQEISRSGILKEEYDRLKVEMSQAEADTQLTYNKKRNIALERKETKMEKEEAEKYQRLKDELADKQVELALFRLYHNEKNIELITDELQTQQQVVQRIEQSKEGKEEELKEKKKEQGKIGREMAKTEQEIREIETEINKKRPTFIKAKEKVAHHQKKLETADKFMAQAKKAYRNIEEPKNVKLLYDVLQFDPPDIKRAVLFATNNALVCESPDDAMKVAYEMQDDQRYDAVALDGTHYQKSGMISGGSLDLARKAKRWDEKHLSNLSSRRKSG